MFPGWAEPAPLMVLLVPMLSRNHDARRECAALLERRALPCPGAQSCLLEAHGSGCCGSFGAAVVNEGNVLTCTS